VNIFFNSQNTGRKYKETKNRRLTKLAGKSSKVMQSNISNTEINSRGFGINKFCVASGNLVARKFEIKLITIKFNGWHAVSLEELHEKNE